MAFEIELKAKLENFDKVEPKLAERGEFVEAVTKEDVYFRRPGETDPARAYRLRRTAAEAVVTFKHRTLSDNVEVNEEVEFAVDNTHAFFLFADHFGFEPYIIKRKEARVYRVGRASVELNEVKPLGFFIEIEILAEEKKDIPIARTEVARLYYELGLPEAALEGRRYIDLLEELRPVRYRFVDDPALDWPFVEVTEVEEQV